MIDWIYQYASIIGFNLLSELQCNSLISRTENANYGDHWTQFVLKLPLDSRSYNMILVLGNSVSIEGKYLAVKKRENKKTNKSGSVQFLPLFYHHTRIQFTFLSMDFLINVAIYWWLQTDNSHALKKNSFLPHYEILLIAGLIPKSTAWEANERKWTQL